MPTTETWFVCEPRAFPCNLDIFGCFLNTPVDETSSISIPERYGYLYGDPEMEIWFQRHCRVW